MMFLKRPHKSRDCKDTTFLSNSKGLTKKSPAAGDQPCRRLTRRFRPPATSQAGAYFRLDTIQSPSMVNTAFMTSSS